MQILKHGLGPYIHRRRLHGARSPFLSLVNPVAVLAMLWGPGLTPAAEAVQGTGGMGSSRGVKNTSGRTEGIYRSGEKTKRIDRRKTKRMGIISLNGT